MSSRWRVFYADARRFEQSLDVHTPKGDATNPLPLVVLVVGSAWLGHRSFIYSFCSWWNRSGPETIARLGAVCVCIRHRGAFPRPPPTAFAVALSALWYSVFRSGWLAVVCALWHACAYGAASHEEMMDDVARALKWVRTHRAELVAPGGSPQQRLVFGGYSSGAHVAASLLHRREVLAAHGLPPPEELCDGVLYLSGVLGTRLACAPALAPPLAPALSDAIVRLAFGRSAARRLPSPVHETERSPALPHLLLGCEHEVFGLFVEAAMGVLFCSREVVARLKARGVDARLVEVRSDHWFMLSSEALAAALARELGQKGWPGG